MAKEYDLLIYGATGFTGQYVVEDLVKYIRTSKDPIKWAVGGRNKEKLRSTLQMSGAYLNVNLDEIPTVVADVDDFESIKRMTALTRVVLNCVGPYILYGEAVVKACLMTGTHAVDLSGELQYMEGMQLEYHREAEAKGVYIVGPCGFDTIPCDIGVNYLRDHFRGRINSVEAIMKIKEGPNGYPVNHGTFDSGVESVGQWTKIGTIRRQLFDTIYTKKPAKPTMPLGKRYLPFRNPVGNGWCHVGTDLDTSVVRRSQMFNYMVHEEEPIQFNQYMLNPSLAVIFVIGVVASFIVFLANFKFGRNLLNRYPHVFTAGKFVKDGPTREQVNNASFKMILMAKGWSTGDAETKEPTKEMVVEVSGADPGYVGTSACFVQSALTILKEADKMPSRGGVLTPGAAFRQTSIVDRLNKNGIEFKVTSSN